MKRYMVIGYTTKEGFANMKDMTDEDRKESMQAWMQWKEEMGEKLLDLGAPFIGGKRVNFDGSVSDKSSEASGYMMIQAKDMEEALVLLNKSPLSMNGPGNYFEILEMMNMQPKS